MTLRVGDWVTTCFGLGRVDVCWVEGEREMAHVAFNAVRGVTCGIYSVVARWFNDVDGTVYGYLGDGEIECVYRRGGEDLAGYFRRLDGINGRGTPGEPISREEVYRMAHEGIEALKARRMTARS